MKGRTPRLAVAAVAAALPSCDGSGAWESATGVGWQKVSSPPPWEPHTGSIVVPLSDSSMLLTAGQAGRHGGATFDCFNCTNEVWRFEPEKAEWKDLTVGVPWDPRWGHSVLAMPDDTVWLMFGCCERGKPTVMHRDIWTYNPTTGTPWTRMNADPPFEGIQAASIAARGTDIWVVGGWSQQRATLSLVCVLDTVGLTWKTISKNGDPAWDTRADHASAVSPDGRWLIIFGGQHTPNGGRNWYRLRDSWRVPLPGGRTSDWEQLGDLSSARSSPSVFVLPTGWLVTLGGHWTPDMELINTTQNDVDGMKKHHEVTEFYTYNDILALDIQGGGKEWKVVDPDAPWPARDDAAAGVTKKGTIVIFGGGTLYGGGGYLQDVWRLPDAASKLGLAASSAAETMGQEL